jgi:hypothetical protein
MAIGQWAGRVGPLRIIALTPDPLPAGAAARGIKLVPAGQPSRVAQGSLGLTQGVPVIQTCTAL